MRARIARDRCPHGQVLVSGVGDEAEDEGFGGSKAEDDNEVSHDFHPSDQDPSLGTPDLRRDPKGWGQFSR
ncbi:MAG: hypothetical protein WBE74_17715, partial [Terracidiphilus sp.]